LYGKPAISAPAAKRIQVAGIVSEVGDALQLRKAQRRKRN